MIRKLFKKCKNKFELSTDPVAEGLEEPRSAAINVDTFIEQHKCESLPSSDYYYRCESESGWERFFSSVFEITKRNNNSRDKETSPEYEKSLKATGNDHAFYYYNSYHSVVEQQKNRLGSISNADSYSDCHGWHALSFISRIKKSTPALSGRAGHSDLSVNIKTGAEYIVPSSTCVMIPDDDIEVFLFGSWLPKCDKTGLLLRHAFEQRKYPEFILTLYPAERIQS